MKTKLVLGFAAGLILASCAQKENLASVRNDVVETDQTRWLSVSLSSPSSAVKGFEDGTAAESEVKSIYFVFYDKDGNPTGQVYSAGEGVDDEFENEGNGSNVTRFWNKVIPVAMLQGQNVPAYVMCYVNPMNSQNINTLPLEDVQKEMREAVVGNDGTFPMTNSVYYGTDPLTGRKGRLMATPIMSSQLFETEAAAKKAADAGDVLNIYVERYAAKIGLTLADNAIQAYEIDGHSLKFVPEYWRPNAIDEKIYVAKAFGLAPSAGGAFNPLETPSYELMNDSFKAPGLVEWNDEANHRCYWACSPSYFNYAYPRVSDDIDDLDGYTNEYALKYYSYNDMKTTGAIEYSNGFTTTSDGNGYFYSRETTANISAIQNVEGGNPAATVASAVIVGRYQVDGADAHTFYLDVHNKKYYADEAAVKAMLLARQNFIFVDSEGKTLAKNDNAASSFAVEHPKKAVRGETPVAGRYVTLQVKEGTPLYVYSGLGADEQPEYTLITAANIDEVNRQLWAMVNTVEIFNDGLAFFAVPIRHLGFDQARCMEDGAYKWEASMRGDYGIVRNHVYNITVTGIKGLGSGLRDAGQPIVPPKDDVNYYVSARLNILAWNVVSSWEVEL